MLNISGRFLKRNMARPLLLLNRIDRNASSTNTFNKKPFCKSQKGFVFV